ncbi:unnamed protein product [Cylindrotheca closterium]|uniref:guanylate cyclase n=1 Tax=Cylindrotheca closterium TaxID=2856 RepID=A0AAD2FZT6_9STRA|nr:unnamed protein product [Cylindrotheca closterium]
MMKQTIRWAPIAYTLMMLMAAISQAVALDNDTTAPIVPINGTTNAPLEGNIPDVGISDPEKQWPTGQLDCAQGYRQFNELTQKKVYHIGIYAPDDIETTVQAFNLTFETYLTEAVGKRWDPPIEFKMVPTRYPLIAWIDQEQDVDMMYADSGFFSCTGTEIGAQPLGTTLSRTKVRGRYYDLDVLGGTMLVAADNRQINNIADLKNKRLAAVKISEFAGGQSQFWVMMKNGLDYIMDPDQVTFTDNQEDVVRGVLDGSWDVGFVRTGVVEQTTDLETGELLDPELFKVVSPRIYIMDDGDLFPYLHSTPVVPEWPLFAKQDLDRVIAEEVSAALINFHYHNNVGRAIHECLDAAKTAAETDVCNTMSPSDFVKEARCDTTREMAELTYQAGLAGRHSGFRSARSHFELRTIVQDIGFVEQNKNGDWQCPRVTTLYDAIKCPEGHYKVLEDQFDTQCALKGLSCPKEKGYSCYCKPCIKAFEVDLFQLDEEKEAMTDAALSNLGGCDKMSLCGEVEQGKKLKFHIQDNLDRANATVTALVHFGQETRALTVTKTPDELHAYNFFFSQNQRGVAILEISVDGVQVPESPWRVEVIEKVCFENQMVANENGVCVCSNNSKLIDGKCMADGTFAGIIAGACGLILLLLLWRFMNYRREKSDEVWKVNVDELHFSHPAEVVGQGAFGVVLLAEYRGTNVAIKRVLPIKKGGSTKMSGSRIAGRSNEVVEDSADSKSRETAEEQESYDANHSKDLEAPLESFGVKRGSLATSTTGTGDNSKLGFLVGLGQRHRKQSTISRMLFGSQDTSAYNMNVLGTASAGSSSHRGIVSKVFPWCDATTQRQTEFKEEMRLLSRLRHPCITTVMGAVMNGYEPMMVMEYMENGSLYDLLRNETLYTGGEIILQIVRDVAQGLRFLHASRPPILHGDLKAKNILIDSRFRAKVGDFGLALKNNRGLSGTPFWLAPEYILRKTDYNSHCDIYSFGIILYEIYSRNNPYSGENPRSVLRKVCDPRINHRPAVPSTCPKRMSEIMKKCWSSDPLFRPDAKDLDMIFGEMTANDTEPLADASPTTRVRTQVATGDMLYKVFPKAVADKLKAGQKVEPETHNNVTIFFSDIVRFTDISRALTPVKVCGMLDRLYLAFDALATKHDVFKVETIGDAWMGVTNLENDQNETHAKRIAEFAIDAVQAASKVMIDEDDPEAGYVHIRVGFHSGPVVSNVIGSLNPRYGLFGDTVNTASRMESLSVSDRIQCSEPAAKILQEQAPDMPLRKRGKVAVKGKGNMVTYWVGESAPVRTAPKFNTQPMVNFAGDIVAPPPMPVENQVSRSAMKPVQKHGIKAMFRSSRQYDSKEEIEPHSESPVEESPHPEYHAIRIGRSLSR